MQQFAILKFPTRLLCLLMVMALAAVDPAVALGGNGEQHTDLSAHALPDGSLPVICFGAGEESDYSLDQHCDECLSPFNKTWLSRSDPQIFELMQRAATQFIVESFILKGRKPSIVHPVRGPPLS